MADVKELRKPRKTWKIALISLVALGIAGGGVGAATANSWMPGGQAAQQPQSPAPSATPKPSPVPVAAAIPATIDLSPAPGAESVNPAAAVAAEVMNGTVVSAVLKESASGTVTEGTLNANGRSWVSNAPLKFDTAYTLDVTAIDSARFTSKKVSTFTTIPSSHEADAVIFPNADATVGVAQPLQFKFSEPVLNKEAVEKAIKITTSTGQPGAFRWYSDTLLRYRGADYWPANSKINVDIQLFGLDLGNGMIGNFNKNYNVNIGNKVVMEADTAAMVVNIYVNDQLTKTYPATMGDEAFPSASGYIVLTSDKQRNATFKASTIGLKPGDPGDYGSVDVEFATRLTYSGIFIHQATPSAMPYLGVKNLSHGCIGLSAEGAGWVFGNMGAGDIVHTVGTPNETIAPTDGFGDWNIPFDQYASR
ncbi:Ig-like domain-containing protein [Arthrobacter sp. LAPM80]|uniref:L,D-transpeptidase n=1 Tax=Arthrobacter sp. LAPM80 TaxID=3141788 RepID=UPI00398A596C